MAQCANMGSIKNLSNSVGLKGCINEGIQNQKGVEDEDESYGFLHL